MSDQSDFHHLLDHPWEHLDEEQRQWFQPPSRVARVLRWILFYSNRLLMRTLFCTRKMGVKPLPADVFVLCPNHTSSLDAAAILAVLDRDTAFRIRWAGRRGAVLKNPIRRICNRVAGTIPVDRDMSALAVAGAVLAERQVLAWFPEGTRTASGELQQFKPGIGMILYRCRVPAVPVYIDGAYDAWPPSRRLPRKLTRITVRFGEPLVPGHFLREQWSEEEAIDALTGELQHRVEKLSEGSPS